eukprot:CAMPEP_0194294726 /NCGR_PEP_ID=MMETSP0169-20130528/51469_1 /TAXON_ID=218684 /ORGANISM="Corethron pennatum, Strain L29A3" /LENGTH=455 /DNA_ID=CAMNT_0039043671 /DNA_START=18 /DNA_END=1385 /DNA_ORIENTATION=-
MNPEETSTISLPNVAPCTPRTTTTTTAFLFDEIREENGDTSSNEKNQSEPIVVRAKNGPLEGTTEQSGSFASQEAQDRALQNDTASSGADLEAIVGRDHVAVDAAGAKNAEAPEGRQHSSGSEESSVVHHICNLATTAAKQGAEIQRRKEATVKEVHAEAVKRGSQEARESAAADFRLQLDDVIAVHEAELATLQKKLETAVFSERTARIIAADARAEAGRLKSRLDEGERTAKRVTVELNLLKIEAATLRAKSNSNEDAAEEAAGVHAGEVRELRQKLESATAAGLEAASLRKNREELRVKDGEEMRRLAKQLEVTGRAVIESENNLKEELKKSYDNLKKSKAESNDLRKELLASERKLQLEAKERSVAASETADFALLLGRAEKARVAEKREMERKFRHEMDATERRFRSNLDATERRCRSNIQGVTGNVAYFGGGAASNKFLKMFSCTTAAN